MGDRNELGFCMYIYIYSIYILYSIYIHIYIYMVGGLKHEFYDFPSIGIYHPNFSELVCNFCDEAETEPPWAGARFTKGNRQRQAESGPF